MSQESLHFQPDIEKIAPKTIFETDPQAVSAFIVSELAEVVDANREKPIQQPLPLEETQDINDIHAMSEDEYHAFNWQDGRSPASGDTA